MYFRIFITVLTTRLFAKRTATLTRGGNCEEIKENFISILLKEKKVEETEGHYFKIGVTIANRCIKIISRSILLTSIDIFKL